MFSRACLESEPVMDCVLSLHGEGGYPCIHNRRESWNFAMQEHPLLHRYKMQDQTPHFRVFKSNLVVDCWIGAFCGVFLQKGGGG